jgi:hypothetical protein
METIGFVGLGHMGGNMACVSARLPDSPERRQEGRTVGAFLGCRRACDAICVPAARISASRGGVTTSGLT